MDRARSRHDKIGDSMAIVKAVKKIVGPHHVATSEAICQSYSHSCFLGLDRVTEPGYVVLAETREQVSECSRVQMNSRYR